MFRLESWWEPGNVTADDLKEQDRLWCRRKVQVYGEKRDDESRTDRDAAAVEKGVNKKENRLKTAVVVCIEHAAFAILTEDIVKSFSAVGGD